VVHSLYKPKRETPEKYPELSSTQECYSILPHL